MVPWRVGVAGVEEIDGFPAGVFRLGEWYGYAFGLPDRHRTCLWCGVVLRPSRAASGCFRVVGVWRRAWWFENWIVDASNRETVSFSVALSRFRQTPFGVWFEIDRFVIIL